MTEPRHYCCVCGAATASYCQVCLRTVCHDCLTDHYHPDASCPGPED